MQDVDIIISGGTVLTMDGTEPPIHDGYIAIRGDEIIAVGDRNTMSPLYRGKRTLEAANHLVMPGLVNCHTHAAMTCFRGIADDKELMDWLNNYIFPAESRNVDPELVYWGSLLACAEMIRSGTTTFCDMYLFEEETAQAAHRAGMRCLLGEVLFDFPSPNIKTPEEGLAYTERLIDKWHDDPLVSIVVEPHSLYTCSPELLKAAKALANRYGVPYATHFLENRGEFDQLKAKLGRRASLYLKDIGCLDERFFAFHCVYMDAKDIDIFAEHGCKVVHNPESNMKLASGTPLLSVMQERGLTVGLGTDGCASNNNLDMLQEMDTAAKLEKVVRFNPTAMAAMTVARMATTDGARVLGLENVTGRLKPGMKADIIMIDLDRPHLTPVYDEYSTLVYAANGSDVTTVIINGRPVMEDRTLLTIDEKEVMDRVENISRRIKKNMGFDT
ncbi:MAG: amidohydrolase [Deltaproteobacteria bacterium]|nr:amidohydrolase [Deltaproteobacteria bacterium]